MAILPFKVTDFGTNRKLTYGFLYQDDSKATIFTISFRLL